LSQDFSVPMTSEQSNVEAYNHVIALGFGEGVDRLIIEVYRTDEGNISIYPLPFGISDKQLILDLPDIELENDLYLKAYFKLIDCMPTSQITLDMTDTKTLTLNLGDVISGRDYVTDLSITKAVCQITRTVNTTETIQYKMGDRRA